MNWEQIEPQVSQLRAGLKAMIARIGTLTQQNVQYPQLSNNFHTAKKGIEHPMYDIVVCGEVKKGKSTLLNAIIGQDILPVDNEIATSQVFRITNSRSESFELVFNDGTRKAISRSELSKYGSQVDANIHGESSFNGKLLSYIQVNIPVAFLPENVSLVDTPGLGAIYKSHEWITQNYVKKAAGVLFVFDSKTPLVKQEQDFINKVLDITPYIMFVMTKIDTVTPSEWTSQLRRTEESLSALFMSRKLPSTTVYPISSTILREAADEDELDFRVENMRASMFPAIKAELMRMITKAVALTHTSLALYESQNQIIKVRTYINDLLKASSESGQQLDMQLKNQKLALQTKLQQEWGADSVKNKQLADEVSRVCNNVANRVSQMFRMTSPIREHYINKIKNLSSMEEVESLGKTMPQAFVNDVVAQWESIMTDAEQEVATLICDANTSIDAISYGGISGDISGISTIKLSFKQKLTCFRNDFFTNMFVGGLAAIVFAPLGAVIGIGKSIWDFITGGSSREAEIERNKAHFREELGKLMDKLNSQLCDVSPGSGRSIVNEFVYSLKTAAEQSLSKSVADKKQEMQNQLAIFENQARRSVEEKKKECETLKVELAKWNELVPSLKQMCELRENIVLGRKLRKTLERVRQAEIRAVDGENTRFGG